MFLFCIVFADQYSKFVFVDLLKTKKEEMASLRKFVLSVRAHKKLRQDKVKEFFSEQFNMYRLDAEILPDGATPETPQQNGLAERCNTKVLEMARCLLIDSGLSYMMRGGAAILYSTNIRNLFL